LNCPSGKSDLNKNSEREYLNISQCWWTARDGEIVA